MFTHNRTNRNYLPTLPTAVLVLSLTVLTACDSSPVEQIKAITQDKYPVANMPDEPLETPLEINIEPKRLAMTSSWSAGVKDDGTLWTWGTDGLLRETKTGQDPTPRQVEGVNDAVAVSGAGHMLLLRKDGTVWGWGYNNHGEIDPSDDDTFIEELRQIKGIENVVDIEASEFASIFLTQDGSVYILGDKNDYPSKCNEFRICKITMFNDMNIVKVQGSISTIFALNDKGEMYTTGFYPKDLGRFEDDSGYQNFKHKKDLFALEKVSLPFQVVDFSYGFGNFALLEDGSLWSWGKGSGGWTAQGTLQNSLKPKKVDGLSKVVKMNSYSANTDNGDLYVWGMYTFEGKMSSNRSNISRPIKVMSNIRVSQYVEGNGNEFISTQGDAWFWGSNYLAQFGTGQTQTERYVSKDETLIPRKSLFNIHTNK